MQHGAFSGGQPFGPFDATPPDVLRSSAGPIDILGATDWRAILRVDTAEYSWGQLAISAEAADGPAIEGTESDPVGYDPTAVENLAWAELRVIATVAGIDQVWFEGAAGNHSEAQIGGNAKSPGPISLPFAVGEVPDRIEVFARARRGGKAQTVVYPGEVLTVSAGSRFRK